MTRTNGDQQNNTNGVSAVRDVFMEFKSVLVYSGGGKICVRISIQQLIFCDRDHVCLTFRLSACPTAYLD
jgi:hypothetical protein